jgi:hypothetical protein
MGTLQEDEEPIEKRIASLLVEATPEWWRKARLEVEVREEDGVLGMPHTIVSPEGLRDIVVPTDELLAATYDLLQVFRKHGAEWRRLVLEISDDDGAWRFVAHYDYPSKKA